MEPEEENDMQAQHTEPDPRHAPPEIPVVPKPEPEMPPEEKPGPEIPQLPPDPAIAPSPLAPEITPEHSPEEMPVPGPEQQAPDSFRQAPV
jgi:hypothetical protein